MPRRADLVVGAHRFNLNFSPDSSSPAEHTSGVTLQRKNFEVCLLEVLHSAASWIRKETKIYKFSNAQVAELNGIVKPVLGEVYEVSAPLFTARGQKIVERALKKGTVGGDAAMGVLFEPAMLLGLAGAVHESYEAATIAKEIPFVGNYRLWDIQCAAISSSYRMLCTLGDGRAETVEQWLSLPYNGGMPGPPVVSDAIERRLGGSLVEHYLSASANYKNPLSLPEFSYIIASRLNELTVMWAFGGSNTWPRKRIDDEIDEVRRLVADFIA